MSYRFSAAQATTIIGHNLTTAYAMSNSAVIKKPASITKKPVSILHTPAGVIPSVVTAPMVHVVPDRRWPVGALKPRGTRIRYHVAPADQCEASWLCRKYAHYICDYCHERRCRGCLYAHQPHGFVQCSHCAADHYRSRSVANAGL